MISAGLLTSRIVTRPTEWELQQGKVNLEIIVKATKPWSIHHVMSSTSGHGSQICFDVSCLNIWLDSKGAGSNLTLQIHCSCSAAAQMGLEKLC